MSGVFNPTYRIWTAVCCTYATVTDLHVCVFLETFLFLIFLFFHSCIFSLCSPEKVLFTILYIMFVCVAVWICIHCMCHCVCYVIYCNFVLLFEYNYLLKILFSIKNPYYYKSHKHYFTYEKYKQWFNYKRETSITLRTDKFNCNTETTIVF